MSDVFTKGHDTVKCQRNCCPDCYNLSELEPSVSSAVLTNNLSELEPSASSAVLTNLSWDAEIIY